MVRDSAASERNLVAVISNMCDIAGMSTVAEDRRLARQGLKVLDHQPSLHDSDGHSVELSDAAAAGLRICWRP